MANTNMVTYTLHKEKRLTIFPLIDQTMDIICDLMTWGKHCECTLTISQIFFSLSPNISRSYQSYQIYQKQFYELLKHK